jgi:uncharacterized membrane protein
VTVASNSRLGGIGSALMALSGIGTVLTILSSALPDLRLNEALVFAGVSGLIGVVGFVGIILFVVSMFGLSRDYREHGIFNNMMYGGIAFVVTAAIGGLILGISIVIQLINSGTAGSGTTIPAAVSQPLLSGFISVGVTPVFGVAAVVFALFFMRSLKALSEKSSVSLFKITSNALLAIAITVASIDLACTALFLSTSFSSNDALLAIRAGSLLQYVIWGLLSTSFFRIIPPATPEPTTPNYTAPIYVAPSPTQVKFCQHCGAQNLKDSQFCIRCGQKLITIE